MVDSPITASQRAYLAAFDRWLRRPGELTALERQKRLAVVCDEVGIEPRRVPEQREEQAMSADQPRPTQVVLAGALEELQAREAKLARLEQELAENRAAIKVLRRLVGNTPARATYPAPKAVAGASAVERVPSEDRAALVLRVIGERQPCASGLLRRDSGLSISTLKRTLDDLRAAGKIVMVGEKAGAKYVLAETDTSQESEAA